ncbi:MAG TPA: 30S ribosomal protein S4 [archaeon]|nr:30S ribosomal protein S4 [archaeon]HLD80488.1 30S ribosomal protein S4 [archaeon]
MGDPKKIRRKHRKPNKMWDSARITEESRLEKGYGLKNKKELWRAKAFLSKIRSNARRLLAKADEERGGRSKELLTSLNRKGVLQDNAVLDDVLTLQVETVLERRLQTQVWKQGIAATPSQARQLIKHGHISLKGKKVTAPGYFLGAGMEREITFTGNPLMLQKAKDETKADAKSERLEKLKSAGKEVEEAQKGAQGTVKDAS